MQIMKTIAKLVFSLFCFFYPMLAIAQWQKVPSVGINFANVDRIHFVTPDVGVAYSISKRDVYFTKNGGLNWTKKTIFPNDLFSGRIWMTGQNRYLAVYENDPSGIVTPYLWYMKGEVGGSVPPLYGLGPEHSVYDLIMKDSLKWVLDYGRFDLDYASESFMWNSMDFYNVGCDPSMNCTIKFMNFDNNETLFFMQYDSIRKSRHPNFPYQNTVICKGPQVYPAYGHLVDSAHLYIVGGSTAYYSHNQGQSWQIGSLPPVTVSWISGIRFANPDTGFMTVYPTRLLRTFDGGVTWQKQLLPQSASPVDWSFPNEHMGYILTGSFLCKNTRFSDTTLTTAVASLIHPQVEFSISPNPATGRVKFEFEDSGIHTILISDALGRKVFDQMVSGQSVEASISNLSPGVYTALVSGSRGSGQKRLCVE